MSTELSHEEIPVPFPGAGQARELPDGGWVVAKGAEAVFWKGPPICRADGPDRYICSLDLDHSSRWHVAMTSPEEVIAVWPVADLAGGSSHVQ